VNEIRNRPICPSSNVNASPSHSFPRRRTSPKPTISRIYLQISYQKVYHWKGRCESSSETAGGSSQGSDILVKKGGGYVDEKDERVANKGKGKDSVVPVTVFEKCINIFPFRWYNPQQLLHSIKYNLYTLFVCPRLVVNAFECEETFRPHHLTSHTWPWSLRSQQSFHSYFQIRAHIALSDLLQWAIQTDQNQSLFLSTAGKFRPTDVC